jgi:16S rRNA (cytosine967-C5)-methyltransferase
LFNQGSKIEDVIIKTSFLTGADNDELIKNVAPDLYDWIDLELQEKMELLEINTQQIIANSEIISEKIDKIKYTNAQFKQPDLYLRIRPGRKNNVIDLLTRSGIAFELLEFDTLRIQNGVSVENVLNLNKDVVVQDLNSQRVFDFLVKEMNSQKIENVWDCCAASGGKSLLLYDLLNKKIKLTVSDIRENILTNLQLRFKDAGINIQKKFVQDLSNKSGLLLNEKFSIIICDVPCTGSGTWARTPEQQYSFDKSTLDEYVKKQQKIVTNVLPHLEKDGWMIYITCSVFWVENEGMVDFIENNFSCQLLEMKYLTGYQNNADTMFVAYFRN